jgi:hypothetical protein
MPTKNHSTWKGELIMMCIKPKSNKPKIDHHSNLHRFWPEVPTMLRRYGKAKTIGYLCSKGIPKSDAQYAVDNPTEGSRTLRLAL